MCFQLEIAICDCDLFLVLRFEDLGFPFGLPAVAGAGFAICDLRFIFWFLRFDWDLSFPFGFPTIDRACDCLFFGLLLV